jgi:hypothetical protein
MLGLYLTALAQAQDSSAHSIGSGAFLNCTGLISVLIPPSEFSIPAVNITVNMSWTAKSDQTWLHVNPASGIGDNSLTLSARANPSTTVRTAIITISTTDAPSKTITIRQAAASKTAK